MLNTRLMVAANAHNRSGASIRWLDEAVWEGRTKYIAETPAQAFSMAEKLLPDQIIADAVLPGMDGGTLLERIRSAGFEKIPRCALAVLPEMTEKTGGMETIVKPVTAEKIRSWEKSPDLAPAALLGAIRALDELGVPHHLDGYAPLLWAVQKTAENRDVLNDMKENVYRPLAEKNGRSMACVERGMRFAIEMTWDRGRVETIWRIFGYTVRENVGKPSNREFIAATAQYVRTLLRT